MTHYWWMHWFWITACASSYRCVTFGQTILTTSHSNSTTTTAGNFSHSRAANLSTEEPISTERIISLTSSKTIRPVVLRNISQYARNESNLAPSKFSSKLDVLPVEVPLINSTTDTKREESTVINQTVADFGIHAANLSNGSRSVNNNNNSENVSYIETGLGYNHSFIQSERIGIEEQDLTMEETIGHLSAAGITGITLGCVVIVGVVCGVSFFIYRNQGFNRPQVLNDRCSNPDSSGYIDDASVRDNSEEMYSLDNDSFLNSLEAMTIQNYWTDTVKHTKL